MKNTNFETVKTIRADELKVGDFITIPGYGGYDDNNISKAEVIDIQDREWGFAVYFDCGCFKGDLGLNFKDKIGLLVQEVE